MATAKKFAKIYVPLSYFVVPPYCMLVKRLSILNKNSSSKYLKIYLLKLALR